MGVDLARRAFRAAPEDPEVLGIAAYVLGRLGNDHDVALSLVDRALVLNPSFARGRYWSGLLHVFVGGPEIGIDHFQKYLRSARGTDTRRILPGLGTLYFFNAGLMPLQQHSWKRWNGFRAT